jgi:hypothetical protein
MRFLRRLMGSVSEGPRARRKHHSAGPRRSLIELEKLETRNLMATGMSMTLSFGNLAITAPAGSGGNVVTVSNVTVNNTNEVAVSVKGIIKQEFAASQVSNITYEGGSKGGDDFTNDTSLTLLAYGYGGTNDFVGGSGYNYVFFTGNNNTFDGTAGIYSDVFEQGGTGDKVIENLLNDNVGVYK